MFDSVNEPSFRLDVAGLPTPFEVLAFTGREAISEPFVFDDRSVDQRPALDLSKPAVPFGLSARWAGGRRLPRAIA
jgi:uncharacterized protein involved in type VI secretion and phage assembly